MARTLAKNLGRAGHAVEHAPHGEAALARLGEASFDVVLTDLKMPVMDGMALLRAMHERRLPPAVVVLTGYGTIESAVEAMKLGAADYLIKDARPQEILLSTGRVLRLDALKRENVRRRGEIGRLHGFGELIGEGAPMKGIYRVINTVAGNKSTVLVSGESGTGKELVARTIHERGPLAAHPFVAINCAGLSETLLDSQLFGHRRGAFTGAVHDHDGVFRAAEGGTLFLDEVAEIPLSLQAKFLRAVEQREVTPLGASLPVPVDVRLIAATNRDLEGEVRAGRFRQDLYYRLNVVHLALPPLRARPEDIPLLAEHFLRRFSREYQVAAKRLAAEVMERLRTYAWPGNVRELQNTIERAFALAAAETITLDDLPAAVRGLPSPDAPALDLSDVPTLEEAERRHAGAVHLVLARESNQLRQQVDPPAHAVGAEVGDELVEVVVRLVGVAVAEAALEVARHDAAVAEGRQLHHGEIEVASVEGDERPPEALDPLPELAHDARLAVAVGAEDLHAGQHALVVHVADDDRHRQVEGEREEVRAGAAARQEVGAGPLVGLLLADLLVAVQDRLDQRLVDARLDVEDREAHGGLL